MKIVLSLSLSVFLPLSHSNLCIEVYVSLYHQTRKGAYMYMSQGRRLFLCGEFHGGLSFPIRKHG